MGKLWRPWRGSSRGNSPSVIASAAIAFFSVWQGSVIGGPADNPKGSAVFATPLVVDLDNSGKPSLLAGPRWKWGRKPSKEAASYRRFDLDGTGVKEWEWVGPNDGLLVWMKDLKGTPTAKDLFGIRTWNKTFNNGFEPLFMLDANKDKVLTGEELSHIGVWQDSNGDAIAQAGEITPVAACGITLLKVTYRGSHSRAVSHGGAICNGRKLHVWDWWSAQRPEPAPAQVENPRFEKIRPLLHAIGFGSCRNPR